MGPAEGDGARRGGEEMEKIEGDREKREGEGKVECRMKSI